MQINLSLLFARNWLVRKRHTTSKVQHVKLTDNTRALAGAVYANAEESPLHTVFDFGSLLVRNYILNECIKCKVCLRTARWKVGWTWNFHFFHESFPDIFNTQKIDGISDSFWDNLHVKTHTLTEPMSYNALYVCVRAGNTSTHTRATAAALVRLGIDVYSCLNTLVNKTMRRASKAGGRRLID